MKIEIDIDERYSDIEVEIKAPKLTQDIEKLISLMRMINMQIAVLFLVMERIQRIRFICFLSKRLQHSHMDLRKE